MEMRAKSASRRPGAAPFAIRGMDHVVLRYRDVARGVRFYCEVLGCTVEKVQPEFGLTQLRAGSSLIDLVDVAGKIGRAGGAAPGKEARNMDHFCLRIEPWDARAIARHLAAHGVAAGEVASRYGAEGEGPSLYLHDPEGNQVELKGPAATARHFRAKRGADDVRRASKALSGRKTASLGKPSLRA